MTGIVLVPLADAFMQVGVFVALLVAPFGWARRRWGPRLDRAVVRYRALGPLTGALLGVTPGCGGAVVLMPLYARGTVSFGTVVAALVATMGDTSFVIIAAEPMLALQLHGMLFVTGLITGSVVDAAGLAPRLRGAVRRTGTSPPPEQDIVRAPDAGRLVLYSGLPPLPRMAVPVFWVLVGAGAVVGVPVVFQLVDPAALTGVVGVDPYIVIGVAGTLAALMIFATGRGRLSGREGPAAEAAFVTVWVAVAYLGWEVLTATTGFDGSQLPLYGVLGIVAGAVVGLVPGCGLQIVFCGLFLAGGMPLSSLAANAVSQDGDALLPLLALEHRSALLASVVTAVPALVVGGAFLAFT